MPGQPTWMWFSLGTLPEPDTPGDRVEEDRMDILVVRSEQDQFLVGHGFAGDLYDIHGRWDDLYIGGLGGRQSGFG